MRVREEIQKKIAARLQFFLDDALLEFDFFCQRPDNFVPFLNHYSSLSRTSSMERSPG